MKKRVVLLLTILLLASLVGCKGQEQQEVEKPVIYLYPESTIDVTVELDYAGQLTCSYPPYRDGWRVTAHPDGELVDRADGKSYRYLFWEGQGSPAYDMSRGFVVAGADTADFLEEKLSLLGLNAAERNDFISYWLPRMQQNNYNLIAFQGAQYQQYAKLNISPQPDTLVRVFMVFEALDRPIEIAQQVLKPALRSGFSAVEWGGCQLR